MYEKYRFYCIAFNPHCQSVNSSLHVGQLVFKS